MKIVKIAQAKNNLSRYLEFVRQGGRVRILDRDTPVADLVPVSSGPARGEDGRYLASLARRGLVRLGKDAPLPAELLRPGPRDEGGAVLAALLEERRAGR